MARHTWWPPVPCKLPIMKAALFFFVVAVAAACAQAADYNGVAEVENALPASLSKLGFQASCLVTAAGAVFSNAATVVGVCLTEPQMLGICIMKIIPQVFQEATFAFNDCIGSA